MNITPPMGLGSQHSCSAESTTAAVSGKARESRKKPRLHPASGRLESVETQLPESRASTTFSGYDVLKSNKLNKILKLTREHSGSGYFNSFIYGEDYRDITEFKIHVAQAKYQVHNLKGLPTGSKPEHVVFCAPAIRNCNAVVIKKPDDNMFYMFHIDQEQACDLRRSSCDDFFEYGLGSSSRFWIKYRENAVITNVMADPSSDKFTKDSKLYASYSIIKPFKLEHNFEFSSSDVNEGERFHVFFDTETEEFLCINNVGTVVEIPVTT